jgi:hypothetical protein
MMPLVKERIKQIYEIDLLNESGLEALTNKSFRGFGRFTEKTSGVPSLKGVGIEPT